METIDSSPSFQLVSTTDLGGAPEKPGQVKIRLTIALAVPAESSSTSTESPTPPATTTPTNRRITDTTKVQGYYRVEYCLLPGEANTGFDIVVFRTAAKIYPDNQDSRIVLTWEDERDNVWIVWDQLHTLDLDRERLLALLSHQILLKIWDGKEYCTVRTKLDKPRIGRALSSLSANFDENNSPRTVVQRLAQNYADKWLAKPMLYKLRRQLPINIPTPSSTLQRKIDNTETPRSPSPSLSDPVTMKSVETATEGTTVNTVPDDSPANTGRTSAFGILKVFNDSEGKQSVTKKRKIGSRTSKQSDEKREKGTTQIVMPSKAILAGYKLITCRVNDEVSLPKAIQDCFASITIEDHNLLKEALAKEFNPLSITISHVEQMPSAPVPYAELKRRCEPVYCSYQLFDQPVHQTDRKSQACDIYWNDLNVYLINLINENVLSQFRNSPIVNIELHDRDERVNSRRRVGSVFGSENTDESIGRVSAKMNLLKAKNESDWYPHGCVRLDLSELWLGQTSLEFYVPVVPGHAGEVMSGRIRSAKHSSSNDHLPIQQGEFLSSGTQMKVVVRLAQSLVPAVVHRSIPDETVSNSMTVAPFTRIIFIFPYGNTKFLTALETCIRTINAKALDFDAHPAHIQVAALSTYKLNEAQQTSHTLNIVTGFHLFDDEQHLFVLEGRQEEAIDVIYKTLPKPEGQNVEILYDSSIHFDERLYVRLGLDLTHVKLSRTLRNIISQPLIFVRETLPRDTFDALDKLYQLIHVGKLSASARYQLFPSIEMLNALNRDFGVPLTEKEMKLFSSDDRSPSASLVFPNANTPKLRDYDASPPMEPRVPPSPEEVKPSTANFLQKNIEQIHLASRKIKEHRQHEEPQVFVTSGPIYQYSCQKLNASENALEQMRIYLRERCRSSSCSFNPEHQSGTFSPYSNEETVFDFHHKLRSPVDSPTLMSKEKVSDWIPYQGYRSSRQSNFHPKTPDPARLEELSKPPEDWYEPDTNSDAAKALARDKFKWIDRKDDFDRWTRPSSISQPISAHWRSISASDQSSSSTPTLFVGDERMYFLRKSPQTEMTTSGRLSATQLDRLTGILKDKPVKKGLLIPKSYARASGTHSAPLIRHRSLTNTPDRRLHSRTATSTAATSISFRKFRV